jgi:putative ABC transport system permease protein
MLAVNRQIDFIQNRDLGFDKEQVLILPPPLRLESGYEGFKSELLKSPAVQRVTASTGNPGSYPGIPFNFISDEAPESEPIRLDFMAVDFDYFTFFDIPVLEGRIFSPANSSDHGRTFILNETAVKKLGWDSAVGRTLREQRGEIEGRVIGVIQDYHNVSLHDHIQPAVYQVLPEMLGQVAVRPAAGKTDEALTFLKKKWAEWAPYNIFYFSYLDEDLTKLYEEERKAVLVFKIASALSVLIACLGLLGLAIHVVEQRTKEIGIRKTLGASVAEIIGLLCRDFLGPVLLANVIAWPIVYYLINRWLQDFVFHASLSVWVFILGGGIALVLPLVTVGFQVFKAAVADPVKTLRYE